MQFLVAKAGVSWNKNTYLNLIKAVSASGQAWNPMATGWDWREVTPVVSGSERRIPLKLAVGRK